METLDLCKKLNDVSEIQFINTHILIFLRCIVPSVHTTPPHSPQQTCYCQKRVNFRFQSTARKQGPDVSMETEA